MLHLFSTNAAQLAPECRRQLAPECRSTMKRQLAPECRNAAFAAFRSELSFHST